MDSEELKSKEAADAQELLSDLSELDEHDLAKKYGLDRERVRILKAINANIPLRRVSSVVNEELWLSEVLKLLSEKSILARTRALDMLAKYLGIGEGGSRRKVAVDFVEAKPVRRALDGSGPAWNGRPPA